jgi:hypothetical protein
VTLPDFLLLGAPKAGTTALHVALARHPQLFMSRDKEPKFFLTDGPPPTRGGPGDAQSYQRWIWKRSEYEALFADAPEGSLAAESTTLYLYDQAAHRRIQNLIPDAKLIAVVRDPVDRAHSNWTHLRSAGLEPEADFLAACAREPERIAAGWAPFWHYVQLSKYGEQLQHLLSIFPREQVLVLRYRDVRESPAETLDLIAGFLGVDRGVVTEIRPENITVQVPEGLVNRGLSTLLAFGARIGPAFPQAVRDRASGPLLRHLQRGQVRRAPLTSAQRAALLPTFDADITLLESVLGETFPLWRDPHNGTTRTPLAADALAGTAYTSIDRPVR